MFTLNCSGRLLLLENPIVMGILNITQDSFYESSRVNKLDDVLRIAEKMLTDGATILDIGGQTTKPNSISIGANEETKRIAPVIESLNKHFPHAYLSIDTYHASVAKNAVELGACMVNDVSGGCLDENMLTTVGKLNVPFVCMHMQGNPETMQQNPSYNNVVTEIVDYFIEQNKKCHEAGIKDVIIDVGFGFGKTIEHNYTLLKNLSTLNMLQKPILVGVSRKSMIYKVLKNTANDALNGTTVLNTIALLNGANILRVHDVKEAKEAIDLLTQMK